MLIQFSTFVPALEMLFWKPQVSSSLSEMALLEARIARLWNASQNLHSWR